MEKLKQYKVIIMIILIVLCFGFYWYEYRPYSVRRGCYNNVTGGLGSSLFDRNDFSEVKYENCLKKNGIEK